MSGATRVGVPGGGTDVTRGIVARGAQVLVVLVLEGALVFASSGRLDWGWAWLLLGLYTGSIAVNAAFLLRTSPEMVAERGRPAEFKRWDALVSGSWGLVQYVLIPVVAGLDARFGWTGQVAVAWNLLGAALLATGLELFSWAMIVNAYFSTAVRIQGDRGQTVCRSGPYRWVRHPGYAGTILQAAGAAALLGSAWAVLPAVAAAALITLRTALEDRMLRAELPGYAEYASVVRYRLLPGAW